MERCESHAEAIVAHYDEKWAKSGNRNNYNHNKVDSNRIGVRCEVATERWISTFLKPQDYHMRPFQKSHSLPYTNQHYLQKFFPFYLHSGILKELEKY